MDEETERRREFLNIMTQETRFTLIQNILAHPERQPTLKELSYVNPSKSKSTVRNHLEEMERHGVVEQRTLPKEDRSRDLPWSFYTLTDKALSVLDDAGLLVAEETLKDMHEMLETTEEIERYINAPRPVNNE